MSRRDPFPIAEDGERIAPLMTGYKMSCCDCGLVHTLNFEVVSQVRDNADGTWSSDKPRNKHPLRVILFASRDNRTTAQLRRHRKYKKT